MPYPIDDEEEIEIPEWEWPAGHPVAGYPGGYYDFIALYNHRMFYECHETLEAVWLDTQTEERDFYQGLIHIATALHHINRRNMKGARLLLMSGFDLLKPYEDDYMHFPLTSFLEECEGWFPLVDKAWRRKRVVAPDELTVSLIELSVAN